jgi:hypothetical protein
MIFNGHTSGPSYKTTVLRDDPFRQLTEIAQWKSSTKLVRPQIPRRIGIHHHIIHGDEQQAAHPIEIRDHVWQKVISNPPVNNIDTSEIVRPIRQRQWDEDQKLQDVITDLIDLDPAVFNYPRDVFARWYDIEYHGITELLRSGVSIMPRFNTLKIGHNCMLGQQEYRELGYLVPITHTVWPKLIHLKKLHTPRITEREEKPVMLEQADVTTAGRRHGTGNKVGKRLLIPDNIEDLPQFMSEFNVVIRPDESLNWE